MSYDFKTIHGFQWYWTCQWRLVVAWNSWINQLSYYHYWCLEFNMIMKTLIYKEIFFQPNHFFSKNKISQKNISYVIFNFCVYHPPLGQPWDFTCTFVPMVGISLQFWSLGWGPSLVYTTQPVGLHGNILSPPPGAPGGGGRRKNWIPH